MEKDLKKIKFIENNASFFTECAHLKLNEKDNVSTALLTILLSENELEQCRNYPILMNKINKYIPCNIYNNFIQIISHLKFYVNRMFNYSEEADLIKEKLDEIVNLYKENKIVKTKKMA